VIGRAIACLRIERGWKRNDLVAKAGISYPYLAEIEDGRKVPSHKMLTRIADALAMTPGALMMRAEQIEADPRNREDV
jgi:transcriptional regulator with XRE-family HTH domain